MARLFVGVKNNLLVRSVVQAVVWLRVYAVRQVLEPFGQGGAESVLQNRSAHCQSHPPTKTATEIADGDDDGTLGLGGMRLQADYRGLKDIAVTDAKQHKR